MKITSWVNFVWNRLIMKKKYNELLNALEEYVVRVAAIRYADDDENKTWYDSRLATAAILFSHLYRRDGLRFLKCFNREVTEIAGLHEQVPMRIIAIERWQELVMFTRKWQKKYYSA
jgi:hypothetical protein